MRPLYNLDGSALSALKHALDGYQRYEATPEISAYFRLIIDALIGPYDTLDIWSLRRQLNNEDERRTRSATVNVVEADRWAGTERLSKRERLAFRLIGEGQRSEAIALAMGISRHTVTRYKTNIAAKLGLASVRDLTRFALNNSDNR